MSEADDARGRLALLRRSFEASAEVKLATFAACGDAIALAAELLIETLRGDGRVLAFGNGGAASDAQHFAADISQSIASSIGHAGSRRAIVGGIKGIGPGPPIDV